MSKGQAPHHSPDEPKSRALVLKAEGYSNHHIGELVGVSECTVRRWIARGREVSLNQESPEMLSDWMRIVRRSQGMQHAVLDVAEDMAAMHQDENLDKDARVAAAKELMKHAMTYNIYAGTGTDKLQKESQVSQPPPHTGPLVIILGVEKPEQVQEAIEGESRDVTDG